MTAKQLIAFGALLLIILALGLYIIFRSPAPTVDDNSRLNAYKDSLNILWKKLDSKDLEIAKRDRKIDSLDNIDKTNNYYYHETIQYINNPHTSLSSLDSIVRSIALPHK
jgi:peptidoglycan hydrolase CwlO-like protein